VRIATNRKVVAKINAVVTQIIGNPKLPRRIAGVEIKKELLIKGMLAIGASCASAVLRIGLD